MVCTSNQCRIGAEADAALGSAGLLVSVDEVGWQEAVAGEGGEGIGPQVPQVSTAKIP